MRCLSAEIIYYLVPDFSRFFYLKVSTILLASIGKIKYSNDNFCSLYEVKHIGSAADLPKPQELVKGWQTK